MNLEQTLELSGQLQNAGFAPAKVFVSSNTSDFAASPTSSGLHPDLQAEFTAAGLEYSTGTFTGGMFYGLERYDFPDTGAGRRLEQVSTFSFRFSVQRRHRRS